MVQKAPLGALLQHIAYPALAKFPRLHHRFFGDRQILAIRFHQFRPKLQRTFGTKKIDFLEMAITSQS